MNTRLTVLDVQNAIGALFPTSDFIPFLNQALDQLTQSGRWKGSLIYVEFDSSNGFITLPYEYSSILGVNLDDWTPPVFSQFHRYIESGPGRLDETKPTPGFLEDMGDGFATLVNIPTDGSTLRVVIGDLADANKTIRFYGSYQGKQIFDTTGVGFNFTPNAITTDGVTPMDTITGIKFPVSATGSPTYQWPIYLYSVAPDTTATLLGIYYPPDIRPSYHRYQTGTTTKAIRCLCQRRFIPVYQTTDWVFPGSLRAVKAAMQAVQCEDSNNYDQAAPLWNIAYDSLNKMTHSGRGAAKPEMSYLPLGMVDPFPNVN